MTRRAAVLAFAALLAVGVVAAGVAVDGPHAEGGVAAARAGLAVTGFQEESDPAARIDASAKALATVGVDGINLHADGAGVTAPSSAALAQRTRAHADHLRAELLVGNFSGQLGDFSEPVAHRLLASAAHRRTVVASLAATVRRQGWDGLCVDLESLSARDTAGLSAFLAQLRSALGPSRSLSIALMNATTAAGFAADGYDLRALGRAATRVILMAYDEHGPWEDTPGPIGALPWQKAGLAVLTAAVPAAKVDLGVAGYGYAWRPHSNDQLSDAGARALVAAQHGTARFDTTQGEWHATLRDGSTLWWSDARSYRLRRSLALAEGLHGVAVWSLGLSDPIR